MAISSQAIGESWCHIRDHKRAATRSEARMLADARNDYGGKIERPEITIAPEKHLTPTRCPDRIAKGERQRALSKLCNRAIREKLQVISEFGTSPKTPSKPARQPWQADPKIYTGSIPAPKVHIPVDERRDYLIRLARFATAPKFDAAEIQTIFGQTVEEFKMEYPPCD